MTTQHEHLTQVYQPELDELADLLGTEAKVVNTGGGCMAIEATVGRVPGTDHPLQLIVTTIDAGLAETRNEIVHWLVGLYDGEEGGEELAEGHHLESFNAAISQAMTNIENAVPPSGEICPCLRATG